MIRALLILFPLLAWAGSPPVVHLAEKGSAVVPILHSPEAEPEVRALAHELAGHLGKITGGTFAVRPVGSEPEPGLLLALDGEAPGELPASGAVPRLDREVYRLRTTTDGSLRLTGRTPLALRNAVWALLHHFGFRHFFPGPNWEIWPHAPTLHLAVDTVEAPDYPFRLLTAGVSTATWHENHLAYRRWQERNRMVSGFRLETGHIYQEIVRRYAAHFAAHPEDLGTNSKLDASQPGALAVAERFALEMLRAHPEKDSVSMDPSDGGGWPVNSPLGSPSNQAITIANHVAAAMEQEFPGRKVGIYAYHEHSPAPEVAVHPNVIVSVATAFIQGGRQPLEQMSAWRAKGAELGVREYLSVFSWGQDLPGRSLASRPLEVARTIRAYHHAGARYWRSEGSPAWGPHGLGYYLAARLLWNVEEDPAALVDDFYQTAFGKAAGEMRAFFEECLSGEVRPLVSSDLVGRMYRRLQQAHAAADTPEAAARVLDFAIYTRYVELFIAYRNAQGDARRAAYEALARFAYRTRESDIFNSRAVFRSLPERDAALAQTPKWSLPPVEHPLKETQALETDELLALMEGGIARNPLAEFTPVGFSNALVRYAPGHMAAPGPVEAVRLRGLNQLHLFAGAKGEVFCFDVRGGLLYQTRGPVRLRLFAEAHPLPDEPVAEVEVSPDKALHTVKLTSPYAGNHRLEFTDGGDLTELSWPEGQPVVFPVSADQGTRFHGPYRLGFYVPPGTQTVSGYSGMAKGRVLGPDGKTLFRFDQMSGPGYFSIEVPPGTEGAWWTLAASGEKLLLTVPPYLARLPAELLLPKEVATP